jgi:UDP-glucose 4-epimerase
MGKDVVVFDNLSAGSKTALLHGEKLVVGDITDRAAVARLFQNFSVDCVIHLAALVNAAESVREPDKYEHVNAEGSEIVWQEAARAGVRHFIYSSSAAVYGNPGTDDAVSEATPLSPSNPYGATKLAGEKSLQETIVKNGGTYVIFRFFNVGGANPSGQIGQSKASRAIMQRLFAVAKGEDASITISGHDYPTADGTVVRDFVHVEDIADAIMQAVDYVYADKSSLIANLGSGRETSMKEVHDIVEKVTGKEIPIVWGDRVPGDIVTSSAAITTAQTQLGWSPKRSIDDIIQDGWHAYEKRN